MKKRLVYLTANAPFGTGEEFILREALTLQELGANLLVVPRDGTGSLFHAVGLPLVETAVRMGLFNPRIAIGALFFVLTKPSVALSVLYDVVRHAESFKVMAKNLLVMPKAFYLSTKIAPEEVGHIHVHWGTTTATIGYILSRVTGVPWSMTLHRGDIHANNLLRLKVRSASFVRCISEQGKDLLSGILGKADHAQKIQVIHMGVDLRHPFETELKSRGPYVIVTPASLLPVKGHRYLIEAYSILLRRGFRNFKAVFCGQGPLEPSLRKYIEENELSDFIEMAGQVPHGKLMKMYEERRVDLIVLPSIKTDDGEHEGIPVSLMEAMSYGVPVISTRTGAIPELLVDRSGILCDERNPAQLADAIQALLSDPDRYQAAASEGRLRVERSFDISASCEQILTLAGIDCCSSAGIPLGISVSAR
jgi:glycosyltransferase involved in cell wall biosynthesis